MTIEDPIEYVFEDKRAIINQRELGFDTMGFEGALRSALRPGSLGWTGERTPGMAVRIARLVPAPSERGHWSDYG